MRLWYSISWLAAAGICQSRRFGDYGDDLASYVTRPDIRAPIYNVTKLVADQISPGYWFLSPYSNLGALPDRKEYTPSQVGPHIYDGDGNLVWSGAYVDGNRNTHDFRTYQDGNKSYISYVLGSVNEQRDDLANGSYVLMDDSYNKIRILPPYNNDVTNIHEFQVFDQGRKALVFSYHRDVFFNDSKGFFGKGYINDCLLEVDVGTGEKMFEWCALDDGISPKESVSTHYADYLHVNSIDKFNSGDYLLSARNTNTIYKIARADKSIQWRLGGKTSDFTMDFNFTSQHHAKIVSENASTVIISILDNAADGWHPSSAKTSSAILIALHILEQPKRAELLQQWYRPDGRLTDRRGNVLVQPNGNYVINWSIRAYTSEFTRDGRLVMEAQFTASRFNSYRVYKLPFIGIPTEPIALKTFRHESEDASLTVAYVSWNGATEVATWQFEGNGPESDESSYMGSTSRTGFETTLTISGVWSDVRAIALDAHGNKLGESAAVDTLLGSSTHTSILAPVSNSSKAPTQNQNMITMSRASLWALLLGTVSLTCSAVLLALSAVYFYRRFAGRASRQAYTLVPEEQDIDLSELAKKSKRDSLLGQGSDD